MINIAARYETKEYEARCRLWQKKNNIKWGTMGCKSLDAHMKGEKHKRYADSLATTVPIQMFATSISTAFSILPNHYTEGRSVVGFADA